MFINRLLIPTIVIFSSLKAHAEFSWFSDFDDCVDPEPILKLLDNDVDKIKDINIEDIRLQLQKFDEGSLEAASFTARLFRGGDDEMSMEFILSKCAKAQNQVNCLDDFINSRVEMDSNLLNHSDYSKVFKKKNNAIYSDYRLLGIVGGKSNLDKGAHQHFTHSIKSRFSNTEAEEILSYYKGCLGTPPAASNAINCIKFTLEKHKEIITNDQYTAIRGYTFEYDAMMNNQLRHGKFDNRNNVNITDMTIERRIEVLSKTIDDNKIPDDQIVYRFSAVPNERFKEIKNATNTGDDVLVDKAFQSTAYELNYSNYKTFARVKDDKNTDVLTLYVINSDNGMNVAHISKFSGEAEVLLNKGLKFQVQKTNSALDVCNSVNLSLNPGISSELQVVALQDSELAMKKPRKIKYSFSLISFLCK